MRGSRLEEPDHEVSEALLREALPVFKAELSRRIALKF